MHKCSRVVLLQPIVILLQPCDIIKAYCDVISVLFCVFAALTADYGATGGNHHPQWATVRGADTTGLPD